MICFLPPPPPPSSFKTVKMGALLKLKERFVRPVSGERTSGERTAREPQRDQRAEGQDGGSAAASSAAQQEPAPS